MRGRRRAQGKGKVREGRQVKWRGRKGAGNGREQLMRENQSTEPS